MTGWLDEHQKYFWSLVPVVGGALLARLMRLRARLNYSIGHSSNLLVDQPLADAEGKQLAPRQLVRTASISIQNSGLLSAKNVEVTFNYRPQIFNVWPARAFEEGTSAFDRFTLKFGSLAPNERVTIEIMSINIELPLLTAVRSDDSEGSQIQMELQRVNPKWFNWSALICLIFGASTIIYLAVTGLRVLVQ